MRCVMCIEMSAKHHVGYNHKAITSTHLKVRTRSNNLN